jgi:hypothetical protein
VPPDPGEVAARRIAAALQGDAEAQFRLAVMYGTGTGVPQDLAEAARWYRQAAEQGHRYAAHNLAVMLLKGDGVKPDPAASFDWSAKAAEQEVPEAQLMLGNLYAGGLGTAVDPSLARHWYEQAAAHGNALAAAKLRAIDAAPKPMPAVGRPAETAPGRRPFDNVASPVLDPALREKIASFFVHKAAEAQKLVDFAEASTGPATQEDMRLLLSMYVSGICSYEELLQHNLRSAINTIAVRSGYMAAGEDLIDHWFSVNPNLLGSLCPELASTIFKVRSNAGLEEIPLLEPGPNELVDHRLPRPMSMSLEQRERPAVRAYATSDGVLYVDPFRYQVLSKDQTALWASASPRRLSRAALGNPESVETDRDIIVLQDRFNFVNFSHFLFDGVTRALLLHQQLGTLHNSLLVFGSLPGDYHAAVCEALIKAVGVSPNAIFFPDGPVMLHTTGRCIWFSDQVEQTLFPAQMAHPVSVGLLRSLVETIPADSSATRRIYISRADAVRRRVLDEPEVLATLKRRGFEEILLSKLSARQQIGLFRGADLVVGPHGMGLTHIIAADCLRGVIELFHPSSGTDTYAFISKAGRIQYDWVTGIANDSAEADYEMSAGGIAQVNQALDAAETNDSRPSWRKSANLLAGSKIFSGFKAAGETVAAAQAVPELIWGNLVMGHRAERGFSGHAPIGAWPGNRVIAGLRYTASCWVWISDRFAGTDVQLEFGPCSDCRALAADLARRQTWQRLCVTGTAMSDFCGIRLRLVSPADALLYSTCWQLERGEAPGPYVETR